MYIHNRKHLNSRLRRNGYLRKGQSIEDAIAEDAAEGLNTTLADYRSYAGRDRRADKKYVNQFAAAMRRHRYVIDCRMHPCRVHAITYLAWNDADLEVESLLNGKLSACSLRHCGIEPISKEQAEDMAAYHKSHTWDEYLVKWFGYAEEALEGFHKLDAEWDFDKGGQLPS